jgi:hypothetical protein
MGIRAYPSAHRTALALATGAGLLLTGCGGQEETGGGQEETAAVPDPSAADVRREVREAAETSRAYMAARRDALRSEVQERLTRLEAEVDALAASAGDAGGDSIDALERQAAQIRAKLDRLDEVTRERWERFGTELDEALGELEKACREVAAELRA